MLTCGLLSTCHFWLRVVGSCLEDDKDREALRCADEREARRWTRGWLPWLPWCVVWKPRAPCAVVEDVPLAPAFLFPSRFDKASKRESGGAEGVENLVNGLLVSFPGVTDGVG